MNNFIGRKPISPKQKNMPNLVHICEGPFIHTQSQPFQHSENKGLGSCRQHLTCATRKFTRLECGIRSLLLGKPDHSPSRRPLVACGRARRLHHRRTRDHKGWPACPPSRNQNARCSWARRRCSSQTLDISAASAWLTSAQHPLHVH